MDEPAVCMQAEVNQRTYRIGVYMFDIVTTGEVLDIGHAIDDGEFTPFEVLECIRIAHLSLKGNHALLKYGKVCIVKIVEIERLELIHRLLALITTDGTENLAAIGLEQFMQYVDAQIASRAS